MAQYSTKEAIIRLEALVEEFRTQDNPIGFARVPADDETRAILAETISYKLMQKILYILSRTEQEYFIGALNGNVIIQITFY